MFVIDPVTAWTVGIDGYVTPNVAKVEYAPDLRRKGWASTELSRSQAVVLYREPLTTQEMGYPRFSHRVNKMAAFACFQDVTWSEFQQHM